MCTRTRKSGFLKRIRRELFEIMAVGFLAAGVGQPQGVRGDDGPTQAKIWPGATHCREALHPLAPCWVFRRTRPQPAWSDPKARPVEGMLELRRVHFDDVFQVAAAEGRVYFGSSADNRFSVWMPQPARSAGRSSPAGLFGWRPPWLMAGSMSARTTDASTVLPQPMAWSCGSFAAPEERRVLGHGKMISLWPVRTGVLVDGEVAYFAAGLFPAEGVFFYAVDARSGRLVWRNDTCGETPQSGISPQGYLLASSSMLYAPMGRVSPAAFDRKTGRLVEQAYFGKNIGGTYALLADQRVFTGTEEMVSYSEPSSTDEKPVRRSSRDRFVIINAHELVVSGDLAYVATGDHLLVLDRKQYPPLSTG